MEINTKIGRLNEEWEENYNSYSNYLIAIIDSFIGKRITTRFGADWGGVNVWGNGGCYEGDFICLDEDYNLNYFSRISNGEVGTAKNYFEIRGKVELQIPHIHENGKLAYWGSTILETYNPQNI